MTGGVRLGLQYETKLNFDSALETELTHFGSVYSTPDDFANFLENVLTKICDFLKVKITRRM